MDRIDELKNILKKEFVDSARKVWVNFDEKKIDLIFEIQKKKDKKFQASVNYTRMDMPLSFGRKLYRAPRQARVIAREDLFDEKPDIMRKIILHEAIHLGIAGHNADFEKIAAEVGTASTDNLIRGGKYNVEEKIGSRFKKIMEFPDKNMAIQEAQILAKIGKKVRLSY